MSEIAERINPSVDSWHGPTPSDEPLQQLPELFRAQAGISHNAAHGMSVNRIMSWDCDDAHAVGHHDMLPLPRDSKSSFFQCFDGAQVSDARDLSHALCRYVHFPRQ